MRILIESSSYYLNNLGDNAMLQCAVARLENFWPGAEISVTTHSPERLSALCPSARPLVTLPRHRWVLFARLHRLEIAPLSKLLWGWEKRLRRRFPNTVVALLNRRQQVITRDDLDRYANALRGADLVVASGGGYCSDAFAKGASVILDTLQEAVQLGKTTVLMGGGFEKVNDRRLWLKMQAVLPRLNLIASREKLSGPTILSACGVAPDRVVVSGDDTVEPVYEAKTEQPGWAIGINIRESTAAAVQPEMVETVRRVVQQAARKYNAPLIPVPISLEPSDAESIRKLLAGYDDASDGGCAVDTPTKAFRQAGACRIVIAGSYHAAVFALAQGIPVVALAKTAYYQTKMKGVADQFGGGCTLVMLDDPNLADSLAKAIDTAWTQADQERPRLLEAAQRQIEAGRGAYRRVYDLVTRKAKERK